MRLTQILTILLITAGCATTGQPLTFQEKIQKYAEEFFIDFPYAPEMEIRSARTISQGLHGRCIPDVPVAIVNPYSTGMWTDGQIQALVYHELGHCALDLAHNNAVTVMGGSPFPPEFTVQDVIQLRDYHRDMCDGKVPGVRSLAFGPNEPRHLSCFIRDSIEDED